jgi:hypothetical protein
MMEYDIHTVLDGLTLVATGIIVFCMIGTDMRQSYQKEQDRIKAWMVVSPKREQVSPDRSQEAVCSKHCAGVPMPGL